METLPMGFTLELPEGVFPLSTDSMVLAHFCRDIRGARWLDLGSGGGTLGLLLCGDSPRRHVTGIEREELAHTAACENIRRNGLNARMESICADLRELPSLVPAGSFSCCVSNPPYFSGGFPSRRFSGARQQKSCTPEDLCRAAGWALKYGGELFLVCPIEMLARWIAAGDRQGLCAKVLRLVRHRQDGAVSLGLLRLRKGGKPGLRLEEIALHDKRGNPTPTYQEIYHLDRRDFPELQTGGFPCPEH